MRCFEIVWGAAIVLLVSAALAQAEPVAFARVAAGVDWTSAGVGGVSATGSGTIDLTGVTGTVTKAYLYWHGIDEPEAGGDGVYDNEAITFAGNPVTGTAIGDSTTNCWPDVHGTGSSRAFRADVTSFVTGNGSFTVAGLSAKTGHSGNGASLIVLFDDGDPSNDRDLVFFEGNDSNVALGFPGESDGWQASLAGINYSSGAVNVQLHVADGQSLVDNTVSFSTGSGTVDVPDTASIWDSTTVPTAGGSRAGNGELWDIQTIDVTSAFGGPGTYTLDMSGQDPVDDCLSLLVLLVDLKAGSAPPLCTDEATFESIDCRLDAMITRLSAAPDLGRLRTGLVKAATKARDKKLQAEAFDAQGKAKQRKNALKKSAKALGSFIHKLSSRSSRKIIPQATRQSFIDEATPILTDLKTLATS
jgi:hypothetical protein